MIDTPKSKSKRNPQPRYAQLDGKALAKPRGRHARASDVAKPKRETVTLPPTARLGFRIAEFAHLTGTSVPTIWRAIRNKKIPIVVIGGIKLVPRAFAIEQGLITSKDTI